MRSMTSFARAVGSDKDGHWAVEIRSVNHRYFEFSLKIPASLSALENRIREQAQGMMRRGKITLSLVQEGGEEKSKYPAIDENAVKFYLERIAKLKKKFKIQGDVTLTEVLRLPGLFGGDQTAADPEKTWPQIKKVVSRALEAVTKAKQDEGAKLAQDIQGRLQEISRAVKTIEKYASTQTQKIHKKVLERVSILVGDKQLDGERLEREVAFLAERTDITEELVRIKSHLDLFKKRIQQDAEVGRELDFLCQEMNREINTMASKSQHFEISTEVVFVKGELEKIREQIQNIE